MWRALASVLLAVLVLGAGAAPASAHATLVSSDPTEGAVLPTSPTEVTFTFDEPVSVVVGGVQMFDAAGDPVKTDTSSRDTVVTAEVPDDLADGTYVVTWRVVSSDGHPIAGSLTFSVGAPSEQVAPPDTSTDTTDGPLRTVIGSVQGIGYVALLLAGGLLFFQAWTVRGVGLPDAVRRGVRRLARWSAGAAVLLAAAQVPLAGAYQRGVGLAGVADPASFVPSLVGDHLLVLALQVVGFGLAMLLAGRSGIAAAAAAAVAVWSPASVGHTRAYDPVSLLVVTDALHLTAGAVWLGGLVGLALCVPRLAGRERAAAELVSRFSTSAAALLVVLALSGVLLGWRILDGWTPLVATTYGRLLLIKVGIALVVVGVAAWNRLRLVGRLADVGHDARRRAARLLRRTVAVEALLLVALLGITGFLVQQPPKGAGGDSTATATGTGAVTSIADEWRVVAVLDAGNSRRRGLAIQIQDKAGEPVDLAGTPVVSLRASGGSPDDGPDDGPDVDLGRVPVTAVATGTYRAEVIFPRPGEWQVQVSLPVDRFTNPVTALDVTVD